jgi:hypothetical protein
MGISRDTVLVEVVDYCKQCPAVLGPRRTEKEGADISVHALHITITASLDKMHRFHRVIKN